MADILCIMYESFKMKPVEIALKRVECGKGRMMDCVNLIKINYKHIYKMSQCIPSVQLL
jgi:hypothetical protein